MQKHIVENTKHWVAQIKSLYETGKMPETVEEGVNTLSYDEVKSKMSRKINLEGSTSLFYVLM